MIPRTALAKRRLTQAEAAAESLAARAFPSIGDERFRRTAARLAADLRVSVSLRHLRIEAAAPSEPTPHAVHARFAVGHAAIPVVAEIDNRTALEIVDRLLGGDGTSPLLGAALSPIQRGLLSYVLLRALDAACPDASIPVSLSGVSSAARPVESFLSRPHVSAVWAFNLAGRENLIRWRLPADAPLRDAAPLSNRLLAAFPVTARLEIARLPFAAAEVAAFRLGDVILLHAPSPAHTPTIIDTWEGDAIVALGRTATPAFSGRAARAGTPCFWRFSIDRIMPPMANTPSDASNGHSAPAPGDDSPTNLLNRIPVTLAVEIARVEMSAAAAAALQVGETILLGRDTGDPVVVTANGAPIGAGELVDVDGELGLRLTRLER
jgi:type III secretion system YscQ/HrcQ family protein